MAEVATGGTVKPQRHGKVGKEENMQAYVDSSGTGTLAARHKPACGGSGTGDQAAAKGISLVGRRAA